MWMEDAEAVAAVMDVKSAHPLSLAFWYSLHHDSNSLQWGKRDWCVSSGCSCWWIQSLTLWKCTACCKSMIFSISWVWAWGNLHLVMRLQMHWDSAWTPLLDCCLTSESSSSLCAQKCSLALIVIPMASREGHGVFMFSSVVVPLSVRVWRVSLFSPSNMSLSCFQPLWYSSASSVLMSRVSRWLRALV